MVQKVRSKFDLEFLYQDEFIASQFKERSGKLISVKLFQKFFGNFVFKKSASLCTKGTKINLFSIPYA